MGYTEYLRSRLEVLQSEKYDRSAVELVTAHGLIRAIIWLLLSPTIFLAFILPLLAHSWFMFFITCMAYTIYGFITYWTILAELEPLRRISGGEWDPLSLSRPHRITMVLFSLLAFLLESLGLWWCLYQRVGWAVSRKSAYRQKTER